MDNQKVLKTGEKLSFADLEGDRFIAPALKASGLGALFENAGFIGADDIRAMKTILDQAPETVSQSVRVMLNEAAANMTAWQDYQHVSQLDAGHATELGERMAAAGFTVCDTGDETPRQSYESWKPS